MAPRLLIVYASQTGNAQDVAEGLGREASRRHYAPQVVAADAFDPSQLPTEERLIVVASTTGQGDPPDNFKRLWRFLLKKALPADSLSSVHAAVFGLGDSGYAKYNVVAKKLAARLSALGAQQLVPLGLGDDQHSTGYEGALDPWRAKLWAELRLQCPLPPGLAEPPTGDDIVPELGEPKFSVTWSKDSGDNPLLPHQTPPAVQAAACLDGITGSGPTLAPTLSPDAYGPAKPYMARLVCNRRLTHADHNQDVRHLEVDLGDSGLAYCAGDSLAMWPETPPALVSEFLQRCQLDGDAHVLVTGPSGSSSAPVRVRALVAGALDIASAPPRRYFFEVMSHFATAEHEAERLRYFASVEGRDDLYRYCNRERRSVLEVLSDFPSATPPLPWLLTIIPRLQPRYFSVSSSPRQHARTAHLTAAVVAWQTPYKRPRAGLCTQWLAGLDPSAAEIRLPVWVAAGSLRLPPSPATPFIAVGPGTGVAPMRAFLQERDAQLQTGGALGAPACLFFGCRKAQMDFLYGAEWQEYCAPGRVLGERNDIGGLAVAFSQDQPSKVYVQHRIREHGAMVWRMLAQGAFVYVSGSSGKMPDNVRTAFEEVAVAHGGLSPDEAKQWMQKAEAERRYQVETWS